MNLLLIKYLWLNKKLSFYKIIMMNVEIFLQNFIIIFMYNFYFIFVYNFIIKIEMKKKKMIKLIF